MHAQNRRNSVTGFPARFGRSYRLRYRIVPGFRAGT